MRCLLVTIFAVLAHCCLFAAARCCDDDSDRLEAALAPLYSQLGEIQDQLALQLPCIDALECPSAGPLGMEDGRIPDASLTASSSWANDAFHTPQRARLNFHGSPAYAWADAGPSDHSPWIQVDFGSSVIITGVITQGRGDAPYDVQRVTEFQVAYSDDGQEWSYVTAEGQTTCTPEKFPGNSDGNTHVTTTFDKAFRAKFLRILPTECHNHCSMRFEVLGCESQE